MKKLSLVVLSLSFIGLSRAEENGNVSHALQRLITKLADLSDELGKPPVPPRDDAGLHHDTNSTPPPVPSRGRPLPVGPTISQDEKKQLISVLKNLDLGDELPKASEEKDISQSEFIRDLKLALGQILQGFDPKTREYIGYPKYSNEFLERFLKDFDSAVKLLRASFPQDSSLKEYDEWRPYLVKAIGTLPKTTGSLQAR